MSDTDLFILGKIIDVFVGLGAGLLTCLIWDWITDGSQDAQASKKSISCRTM